MTELQAVHLLSGQKHSLFGSVCASHTLLVPCRACNIACFLSPSNETGAVVTSASLSLVWGAQTFLLLLLFIEHFWPRQWKNWIFYSAVMTGWAAGLGVYRLRLHISFFFFFFKDLRFWHFQLPQDLLTLCRIHGYLSRIQAFTARSEELPKWLWRWSTLLPFHFLKHLSTLGLPVLISTDI